MSSVCMHYILLIHSSADGHLTISTVWLMWIVLLQTHLASFCLNSFWVCILPNPGLCAWCTGRPKKPKHWSLRQINFYCRVKENGQLVFKKSDLPNGFWGRVFISKIWRKGCRGVWPSGIVTVIFQDSQLALFFQPVGGPHACRSAFIYRSWSAWGT